MALLKQLHLFVTLGLGLACLGTQESVWAQGKRPPNVIVILCDNLGYGDIGCFGSKLHRTPNLDQMAAEGMKFTDLYAASGVCTPSRAALLTGCYPPRVDMHKSDTGGAVLQPVSPKGLSPDEITIAELLKTKGYATTIIGKWHLGDQLPFLPTRQGFDSFYGIPYSDDMTPREGKPWPDLPLMCDEVVIDAPVDLNTATRLYTLEAIRFIAENRQRPFFLYLPQAMPGSTRAPYASDTFRGKSENGPWGDSIEELDWSTGQILKTLELLQLKEQTLVIRDKRQWCPTPESCSGIKRATQGLGVHHGGRRHARSDHCLVAGDGTRRNRVRGGSLADGPLSHDRPSGRSRVTAGPGDRWQRHSATSEGRAGCEVSARGFLLLHVRSAASCSEWRLEAVSPAGECSRRLAAREGSFRPATALQSEIGSEGND